MTMLDQWEKQEMHFLAKKVITMKYVGVLFGLKVNLVHFLSSQSPSQSVLSHVSLEHVFKLRVPPTSSEIF